MLDIHHRCRCVAACFDTIHSRAQQAANRRLSSLIKALMSLRCSRSISHRGPFLLSSRSESLLTDIDFLHTNLDPDLFPGLDSHIKVHNGFKETHEKSVDSLDTFSYLLIRFGSVEDCGRYLTSCDNCIIRSQRQQCVPCWTFSRYVVRLVFEPL